MVNEALLPPLEFTSCPIEDLQGRVFAFDLPVKQHNLAVHTVMRWVVSPASVVTAVAGAVDLQRAFGTPVVLGLDHDMAESEAVHGTAASHTWVDGRKCSAPVPAASYLVVELVPQPLGDEPLAVC